MLREAVSFYEKCRIDPEAGPTGAYRDAVEWIIEAAIAFVKEPEDPARNLQRELMGQVEAMDALGKRLAIETGTKSMRLVPKEKWPPMPSVTVQPVTVWRDADFLAILYPVPGHLLVHRLTVVRSAGVGLNGLGRVVYRDGITWDELMQVKRDCGFADRWAVEIFPSDNETVNVANMRHLWLLPDAPPFAWRIKDPT